MSKPTRSGLLAHNQFTQSYHAYMGGLNDGDDDETRPSTHQSKVSNNATPLSPLARAAGKAPTTTINTTTAITDEERAEFLEMFRFAARPGNNRETRDKDELKYLMTLLRLNPTEEELDDMMRQVDADNSGDIDFDEWLVVMSETTPFSIPSGKLRQSLRMFEDEQKEGFCSNALLKEAIQYYCSDQLSRPDELDQLLSKLDPASSGMIKIDDFMSIIVQSEKAVADDEEKKQQLKEQQAVLQKHLAAAGSFAKPPM